MKKWRLRWLMFTHGGRHHWFLYAPDGDLKAVIDPTWDDKTIWSVIKNCIVGVIP